MNYFVGWQNLFYSVLQEITVLLTLWLGMMFILEGCARKHPALRESCNMSLYSFSCINRELIRHFVFRDLSKYRSNAGVIYELLLAKSGLGVILSLSVADMGFIICYLCVS